MKPDTILLLTEHGSVVPEAINVNIESPILADGFKNGLTVDVGFITQLKNVINATAQSNLVTVVAESTIPQEIITPLSLLLKHLPETRVVIFSMANFSLVKHQEFGEILRQLCLETNKRMAVIASGHLAKNSTKENALDTLCLNFLKNKELEKILHINTEVIEKSKSDLMRPLATLIGTIAKMNLEPKILSYEHLDNENQLVANFTLK